MGDELKLEDLAHLMDMLHDVQKKWYNIGLQLGLAVVADLEIIKSQTTQTEQECLREMLIKWLRSGRATISALCKALRNRTVGEDVLAGEIERSQQPADQSSTSKQQIGSKTSGGKNPHPPPPNSPPPPKRTKFLEEPKTKKPTKQFSHATQKSTPKEKTLLSVPESFGEEDFSRAQPPDRLCVKCNRVPLNPQRSDCCNRLYCKPCADKFKKCSNKLHTEMIVYKPDKELGGKVYRLTVKCVNWRQGCEWKGEMFRLRGHVSECSNKDVEKLNVDRDGSKEMVETNIVGHIPPSFADEDFARYHTQIFSHTTQAAQKSTPKEKKLLSVPESFSEEDFSRAQPPDRLCVKCHRVPRNPQRSVCCNRLYCKPCADKTKKCNNKKHKEELQYTPDKKLHQNIRKLKIKCKNRTKGCDWEGEVFNLKKHLPECPREPSTSTNSRQQPVCLNSEPSLSTSTSSTTTASPRRISHTGDQREPRLLLPSNSSTTTQPSAVPNPPPRQTSASATFGHAAHTSQSAQSHSASLNIQFEATSTNTVTNATPPVHLAMTNVNELQRASTTWVSQSFLSHQLGYRLCLAVHVSTDNQLRIGVTLAQGQQNSFLKFPCSGIIIVKVMHPLHSNTAVEVEVPFTLSEGGGLFMPVLTSQCVAFNDLVARNCLFFQVSRIYLDYKCQPWLLGPNYTSTNNNP